MIAFTNKQRFFVSSAKAEIQGNGTSLALGPCFRRDDEPRR